MRAGLAICALVPAMLALAAPSPCAAAPAPQIILPADGYVLGDSLGERVAEVSHLKGLAKASAQIRGLEALQQLAAAPANATVFMVLGTNDANGPRPGKSFDKSIDDIVAAAEAKSITLIWLGPPCVKQSWDSRARDLDTLLRARFAGTDVLYVGMRDAELCSGALHEGDGVHLKTQGYVHMWEKAAGYALAPVAPQPASSRSASIPLPQPRRPPASDIKIDAAASASFALAAAQPAPKLASIPLPLPRPRFAAELSAANRVRR